jgi:hypothetical protein
MLKAILVTMLCATSYWGYCNYQTYPRERKPSPCHRHEKDKDEVSIFSKWNPVGRDKPVYKIECKERRKKNGPKYIDMEITKYL